MNLKDLDLDKVADDIEAVMTVKDAVDRNDWEFLYNVIFRYDVEWFHREWVNFQLNNRFTVIAGARGFGKTVVCTKGYSLFESVKSRERRILIVGKTFPLGRKILREVRLQLQRNELMKVFGSFFDTSSVDSETELIFCNRKSLFSEPNISCIGIGSSKIGGHYDIILCDDLVDNSNCSGRNAELLRGWVMEELMGMLLPGGQMHFVQSRYGQGDLWVDLEKTGIFLMKSTAAIQDGKSIWEDKISMAELRQREQIMTTPYFTAQFLQDVSLLGRRGQIRFREGTVERRSLASLDPKKMEKVCGVDLGASLGQVGARTVFSVIGRYSNEDENEDLSRKNWILDISPGHWNLEEIDDEFNAIEKKWGEIQFRVEANAIQLLIANAQAEKHDVEGVHTFESRPKRRERLAIKFNSGAVGYVEGLEDEMSEFWEWPDGVREDVIDSVDIGLTGLEEEMGEGDFESMDSDGNIRGEDQKNKEMLEKLKNAATRV